MCDGVSVAMKAFSSKLRSLLSLSKQLHRRISRVASVMKSLEGQVLPSTAPTTPRP